MHYRWLRIATTAAVTTTLALAAASGPLLAAPETTPPASTTPSPTEPISVIELAPGVTAEVFAGAPSDRAPDQTVYLARFVFQGGSEIFPHSHPGTVVLGVESGSFGWTLLEGTAHVVRGAAAGNTGPVEDVTEPGTEVILEVGDAIYYEDDVTHTARSAGDEPTVVLGTLVLTTGEPLLMPADMDMSTTSP
jgi:quercetin dioxygenase-like cupin family protein